MSEIQRVTTQLDVEELACYLCGLNPDESDYGEIENAFYSDYGMDLEQFETLLSFLLPLIDVGESPLTKKRYKGFSKLENGIGTWLIKIPVL